MAISLTIGSIQNLLNKALENKSVDEFTEIIFYDYDESEQDHTDTTFQFDAIKAAKISIGDGCIDILGKPAKSINPPVLYVGLGS